MTSHGEGGTLPPPGNKPQAPDKQLYEEMDRLRAQSAAAIEHLENELRQHRGVYEAASAACAVFEQPDQAEAPMPPGAGWAG